MTDKEEPVLLDPEDLEDITSEEYKELEELVEEYSETLRRHDKELEDILSRINNTTVYEKLDIEIHVSHDYTYFQGERDE